MSATVPHRLLDEDGVELRIASFAYGVDWQPGDTIMLAADERYLVLERRDGETVVLVVERR